MTTLPEFNRSGHVIYQAPETMRLSDVPTVIAAIEEAVMWCPWVVVDMRRLTSMDTAGLHVLMWGRSHAKRHGGDLVIVNPPANATAVSIRALGQLFAVYDALDDVPFLPLRREPDVPARSTDAPPAGV